MGERKAWIDNLKGFLMILVIWSHTTAYTDFPGYFLTAAYMAIYFILTGYTTSHWSKGMGFIKKKMARLLLPYFTYGIILMLFHFCEMKIKNELDINEIIWSIFGFLYNTYIFDKKLGRECFLRCGNNTFWFLTTMFLSTVIANYIMAEKREEKRKVYIMILIFGAVVLNYFKRFLLPWGFDTSLVGAILIITGYYYKRVENFTQKYWIFSLILYFMFIHINPGINMAIKEYGPYGLLSLFLFYIIAVLATVCYIEIFKRLSLELYLIKLCNYIGKNSIVYLCTQIVIIRYTYFFLSKILTDSYILGIGCMITTIVLGFILNKYYENLEEKNLLMKYL